MLDATMKQQLGTYLELLRNPIELTVSTDNSAKAQELVQLAKQIAELSSKVTVEITAKQINGRWSVMAEAKEGAEPRLFFAVLTLGHVFTSLVLALLDSGR